MSSRRKAKEKLRRERRNEPARGRTVAGAARAAFSLDLEPIRVDFVLSWVATALGAREAARRAPCLEAMVWREDRTESIVLVG